LSRRIYLDNAATSWPKPTEVYDAVDRWQRHGGAPAGRGAYDEALQSDRLVHDARRAVAVLLGVKDPKSLVFAFNGTDALHLAIQGLIRPGDHVVTTVCEHNSVLRPLRQLADVRGIEVAHVGCNAEGVVSAADVLAAVGPRTKFVAVTHASNVTGALQPIAEIGDELRRRGITFVVDAAQSAGEIPIDLAALPADFVAMPGHKGLLGPLGTGVLYVRPGCEDRLMSIRTGGTGSESRSTRQPTTMPDKFESGNLNVPGLVGLGAAARWLAARGVAAVREHTIGLVGKMLEGLAGLPGLAVVGPGAAESRVGVVSVRLEGYDPQELAAVLSASYGIECRAGLHCAPLMHRALGTYSTGGTLRLSCGPFTTDDDVNAAAAALREISTAR
jgi:cysteine desulfurase family protein